MNVAFRIQMTDDNHAVRCNRLGAGTSSGLPFRFVKKGLPAPEKHYIELIFTQVLKTFEYLILTTNIIIQKTGIYR